MKPAPPTISTLAIEASITRAPRRGPSRPRPEGRRGAEPAEGARGHQEVVAPEREAGRAEEREHGRDGRAAHVVGRGPALVGPAQHAEAGALGGAAGLAGQGGQTLGGPEGQGRLWGPRPA